MRRRHSSSSVAKKVFLLRRSAMRRGSVRRPFNWREKYAGLIPSEMKRLSELEQENARLKKIVADLSLDKEMLQDIVKRTL